MLSLNLNNNIDELSQLGPFVEEVSEVYGIAPDVSFQLNLALDEALANSVSYAYPEGTEGSIILEAEMKDGNIMFRIIDMGTPFDPTKGGGDVDIGLSVEERPVGGLGIFLIKQMMDEMNYERVNNKNILTLTKKVNTI